MKRGRSSKVEAVDENQIRKIFECKTPKQNASSSAKSMRASSGNTSDDKNSNVRCFCVTGVATKRLMPSRAGLISSLGSPKIHHLSLYDCLLFQSRPTYSFSPFLLISIFSLTSNTTCW